MSDLLLPGSNAILDGVALPATLYLQLHTGNPGSNGTSNVATMSTRKPFSRTAAASGNVTNSTEIQWLNAPTSELITHTSVWSAASGGVAWFADDNTDTQVYTGDSVTIVASVLSIFIPYWT